MSFKERYRKNIERLVSDAEDLGMKEVMKKVSMNKRCIVNLATGEFYCKMQWRLLNSFMRVTDNCIQHKIADGIYKPFTIKSLDGVGVAANNNGIDLMLWYNCLPHGSRPHSESPYGFKVHAIKAAYEMGYTSILWLDSPAYVVKEDISPIFDKIEKEGYYAMSHIDPLENYVGFLLPQHGLSREDIKDLNLPSGSCYGFDLSSANGSKVFSVFSKAEKDGFFNKEKRHDESLLALILKTFNLPVFTFDELFQSPSPNCVIRSGEMLDITPNI